MAGPQSGGMNSSGLGAAIASGMGISPSQNLVSSYGAPGATIAGLPASSVGGILNSTPSALSKWQAFKTQMLSPPTSPVPGPQAAPAAAAATPAAAASPINLFAPQNTSPAGGFYAQPAGPAPDGYEWNVNRGYWKLARNMGD